MGLVDGELQHDDNEFNSLFRREAIGEVGKRERLSVHDGMGSVALGPGFAARNAFSKGCR